MEGEGGGGDGASSSSHERLPVKGDEGQNTLATRHASRGSLHAAMREGKVENLDPTATEASKRNKKVRIAAFCHWNVFVEAVAKLLVAVTMNEYDWPGSK